MLLQDRANFLEVRENDFSHLFDGRSTNITSDFSKFLIDNLFNIILTGYVFDQQLAFYDFNHSLYDSGHLIANLISLRLKYVVRCQNFCEKLVNFIECTWQLLFDFRFTHHT